MKGIHIVFTAFIFFLITGCYPVSQTFDSFKAPKFRPEATFKVVTMNTSDRVLSQIEQQLLAQGFRVISDNYLRTQSAPAGNVTVTTNDTTYTTTHYRSAGIEIFKEKPTDYVIRYESVWRYAEYFDFFNASVVNTQTGEVEFTYNFRQGNTGSLREASFVLRDFVVKMRTSKSK